MIDSLYLLPNSPLLLKSEIEERLPETRKTFTKIAETFEKNGLTQLLTLSMGTGYHRTTFSPIIHREYAVSFGDFGDLVTGMKIPVWWDAYHALRMVDFTLPLEPIDHTVLDYPHGLPLYFLLKHFRPQYQIRVLAINLPYSLAPSEYQMFGKSLKAAITDLPGKSAVIGLGNLAVTKNAGLAKDIEQINTNYRNKLNDQDFEFPGSSDHPDILPSTLPAPLHCLKGMFPDGKYKELSFEKGVKTALLTGEFNR